jgi:regulator of sirC expression with transglutaminase-like and TPR domain
VEVSERFARLVQGPEDGLALDEACLLVAAHFRPGVDVEAEVTRIDDLAADVEQPTFDGVVDHLCRRHGFRGDTATYADPDNSFLDRVLDRRRGIPISLSVLAMEIGRRLDVAVTGVGMPGHFLIGDGTRPDVFADLFSGGVALDRAGCINLFHHIQGPDAAFVDAFLAPNRPRAIVARVLANLRAGAAARGDRRSLLAAAELRALLPGGAAEVADGRDLAGALAALGRFAAAAAVLEASAEKVTGADADRLTSQARRLRARLN